MPVPPLPLNPTLGWVSLVYADGPLVRLMLGCGWDGAVTFRVKLWVASGVAPLLAVMVSGKVPVWLGVPAIVALPSWLSVKVIPFGRVPAIPIEAVGWPVVVTTKDPAC